MSIQQLQLVPINSHILNQRACEISKRDILSEKVQSIIDAMFERAKVEQGGEVSYLVGLAAPQLGLSKRIILVDISNDKNKPYLKAYINPAITYKSENTVEDVEGCYSTDDILGIVARAEKIAIKAFNRDGEEVEERYSGLVARIFQHEIDHLDGVRFPDRIDDERKIHRVSEEDLIERRYQENIHNWPKYVSKGEWQRIKEEK